MSPRLPTTPSTSSTVYGLLPARDPEVAESRSRSSSSVSGVESALVGLEEDVEGALDRALRACGHGDQSLTRPR